ncbi:MAG: radical family heme chaperone HemW [Verrucomicrobiota bacterium]|jgi:oxygen-independent coproporphyrinogen-3 oxidase
MALIEHLYFHIPFCPKLCPYCCFYVEEGSRNKNQAFLDALLLEVERACDSHLIRPKTLYFGGGTPTSLLLPQLEFLLSNLHKRLPLGSLQEWTMEANPATIRPEKAALLRDMGVTRISLGVQSWNDSCLKTLGRVHSSAQARKTVDILHSTGFPGLNLDLMFSVPGQTLAQWEEDLHTTLQLAPSHISAYCLTYEEDTDFFRKRAGGQFVQNEEHDAQLFELTMDRLGAAGFRQYEISNYAPPGKESRHNQAYWEGKCFLGFGPSAFSTLPGERTQNVPDTARYVQCVLAGQDPVSSREPLTDAIRLRERIAFGLRMEEGLESELLAAWPAETAALQSDGLLETVGSRLRLTRRGKLLADSVAEAFL